MSRLKSEEEYEKTAAFHFFRWLSGSKDYYVGNMEMQPQEEYKEEEATIQELSLRQLWRPTPRVRWSSGGARSD